MKHEDFNVKENGFVGHLAQPDNGGGRAVIVIMGGEKSILPGIKIAERFADYGFIGLAVSLFGAEGIPASPDRIPLEMLESAVKYLKEKKKVSSVSTYGQSMGSIFAALTAQYVGGIDNVIMVSPTHVPFEGTLPDRKTMTGHSVAVWRGQEIPFVKADFSKGKAKRYRRHPAVNYKVMGMWKAYYDSYLDQPSVNRARLQLEKTGARILMIAGGADEAWPAELSVKEMKRYLDEKGYEKDYKMIIYPDVSHLTGMMPNKDREKRLYRMLSFIGLIYKSFGKHKKECLEALEKSEKEIIGWLNG